MLAYLSKTPADADANYALGRSYMEMEQMPNAIKFYEKAVQADGSRSQWFNELGILYYTAENYKNAVINFNKAAAAGLTVTNDFNENLGFSYIYSGEFDKGEKLVQELIARKPGNKDLLRDVAQAFYDRKMYDKSLDYCQKLLELDAKDAQALYQAGMCFQKKGEKDRGQAMCDKAIEMDPSLAKNRKQMQMPGGL
ncbi:tetratricopeptide repeat protein [Ferruginibacter sp.]